MRRRVTMAQNWIIDRGLMLMDEPFSALDVHTRQRMEAELLTLWENPGGGHMGPPLRPGDTSRAPLRPADASRERLRSADTSHHGVGADPRVGPAERKTVLFVTHDLEEAIALADEVVVLSAGPASRIVARHPVTLDRPRDLMELRTTTAFVDLYRALWAVLREEVVKSQRRA